MEHLRLGCGLRGSRLRRRIVLSQPLRRLVLGIEPDGPLAQAEPLRTLARQRSFAAHGGRLATPGEGLARPRPVPNSQGLTPNAYADVTNQGRLTTNVGAT